MSEAVLLNGTVGAGKSTTAAALSDRLAERGVLHAVIDTDQVRLLRPPPIDDPFQQAVAVANLRDLAANYRAAGATRLIVAGVIEAARDLADVRTALRAHALCVRLTVDPVIADTRLRRRHEDDPDALDWHLERSPRLAAVLHREDLDDVVIDTTRRTPSEVAAAVADAVAW